MKGGLVKISCEAKKRGLIMENVKLIIVEDEPAILRGIELLIGQIDLPIEIVGTYLKGQDALDEFEKVSPDIVLTDVQMPVITGVGTDPGNENKGI